MPVYLIHICQWDDSQSVSIVCVAHWLQNAVKHAVVKQSMQKILAKCDISRREEVTLCCTQEVATKVFYMIQRLVQLMQSLHLYLADTMFEDDVKSYLSQ